MQSRVGRLLFGLFECHATISFGRRACTRTNKHTHTHRHTRARAQTHTLKKALVDLSSFRKVSASKSFFPCILLLQIRADSLFCFRPLRLEGLVFPECAHRLLRYALPSTGRRSIRRIQSGFADLSQAQIKMGGRR